MAQLRQAVLQATLQQTPSAQWPEAHSASALHEAASIFTPQLPLRQVWPATQSASLEQPSKQAILVSSQEKGGLSRHETQEMPSIAGVIVMSTVMRRAKAPGGPAAPEFGQSVAANKRRGEAPSPEPVVGVS